MRVDCAFLDSGTGGIPYMQHLMERAPERQCVYVADSAHFPYGEKTPAEIIEHALAATTLIVRQFSPRAVIIACNTISVTALPALRAAFPTVPIVGTVPAIKRAAAISRNRRIGLLATRATIAHPYTVQLEQRFAADCTIVPRADGTLIAFIEHDLFGASAVARHNAVAPAVSYFLEHGCDTIVLACTHFLHMAEDIAQAAGAGIAVIDSRDGVVRQALAVIAHETIGAKTSCSNTCNIEEGRKSAVSQDPVTDRHALSVGHILGNGTVYVSGFTRPADEAEYCTLCARLQLPFGGLLQ
ncbi:MAG: glutamate racemase [Treponema sp.]|nr:glutamate racemase [Treponema sp.]